MVSVAIFVAIIFVFIGAITGLILDPLYKTRSFRKFNKLGFDYSERFNGLNECSLLYDQNQDEVGLVVYNAKLIHFRSGEATAKLLVNGVEYDPKNDIENPEKIDLEIEVWENGEKQKVSFLNSYGKLKNDQDHNQKILDEAIEWRNIIIAKN